MQAKDKTFTLALVIMLLTLAQFNSDLFLPSMPAMVDALSTDMVVIQRIVVAAMVAFGCALFIWGPLSDHLGRRRVALWGIGIFVLGGVLSATATNVHMLIIGRAIQGLGISCAGAIAPVIPKDIFEGPQLVKAFATISMAMAVMPMVAQVLGGYVQDVIGWRMNFIFLLAYGALVWGMLYKLLPETNPNIQTGPLPLKRVTAQYFGVLKDREFQGYLGCLMLILTGEMIYVMISPFWLQNDLGLSSFQNGCLAVLTSGGLFLGAFLSSRLAKHKTPSQLVGIGIFCSSLGTVMMLVIAQLSLFSVMNLVMPFMFFMVGAGFVYPNCIAGIMNRFPNNPGVAGALMSSLQMAGAGLLAGAIRYCAQTQMALAVAFASIILATVIAYWYGIKGRDGRSAPDNALPSAS